ncbi:MAG: hypothetical protein ACRCZ0_06985 [Cetobacterium sp.]
MVWKCKTCNHEVFTITKRIIEEEKGVRFSECGEKIIGHTIIHVAESIICNHCHLYSIGTDIADIAELMEE